MFRIERQTTDLDLTRTRTEVVYGLSSLAANHVGSEKLLQLVRGHWGIENKLHWVRDVTFDEDRSQIRKGNGAPVMASLRNLVISLFRLARASNIARALRHCTRHLRDTLRLIGLS